jgi:hypothetical protein
MGVISKAIPSSNKGREERGFYLESLYIFM